MEKLISIIIPLYNRFSNTDRAISSVLEQSYKKWELFVIDDASAKQYKLAKTCGDYSQNITIIRNEKNLGPGLSRQKGLDQANGDYICFLDSDDFWKPDFLLEGITLHEFESELGATYCQSEMSDGSLRRRNELHEAVDDIFFGVVSGARPWATCAIMWKRSFIATWTNQRTNQDAYFEIGSAILNPRIKLIPKVLCVIDKETNFNTENLVKKIYINKDRLSTLMFAQSVFTNYQSIKKAESFQALVRSSLSRSKKTVFSRFFFLGFVALIRTLIFKFKHKNEFKI